MSIFDWGQIRPNTYLACKHKHSACFYVALLAYITPGPSFLKMHTVQFYQTFANNKHIGILDVLIMEIMLVTTGNPGPLPSRS